MSIFLHRSFLSYKIYPKKKCANRGKFFTFKVLNGHKKQTTLEMTWAGRKEWASKFSWLQTSWKVESQQTLKILSIILKAIFNLGKWKLFSIMGFSELNIATSHNWAVFIHLYCFVSWTDIQPMTTSIHRRPNTRVVKFCGQEIVKVNVSHEEADYPTICFCMLTNINLTK